MTDEWTYTFNIWRTAQGLQINSDEELLLPSFLDAFIDLNEERLIELLGCSNSYLRCFWEEDDNDVLCKPGTEEFEERLPIPRGIPFKDEAAHKQLCLKLPPNSLKPRV
jgi:hypothetical protein